MNLKLKDGSPVFLVGAGSDESDFSTTSFAVVELTKELFETIASLRMGREICAAYEVTKFSYNCNWLSEDEFAAERDETSMSCEDIDALEEFTQDNKGVWQVEPLGDYIPTLRDDCTQIHVSEYGIKFTAYIKHTNTRIWTEKIPYELIYKLKL